MEAFDISRPESPASLVGPPPIPNKSHFRGQSQQANGLRPRALISPLILSNERNRSQSEGSSAPSAALRQRRAGLVVNNGGSGGSGGDEKNNSHARGISQGSSMSGSTISNNASTTSSLSNRPLSDLMEHKRRSRAPDFVVEAAKTILYALARLHNPIIHILRVTRFYEEDDVRRSLIFAQRVQDSNLAIKQLNDLLQRFDTLAEEDDEDAEDLSSRIREVVGRSVRLYGGVIHSLFDNASEIVRDCDPRYLRTLMVLQQASLAELRGACSVLGVDFVSESNDSHDQVDERNFTSNSAALPNLRRPPLGKRQNTITYNNVNQYGLANGSITNGLDTASRANTITTLSTSATPRSGESFTSLPNGQYDHTDDVEEAQFERIYLRLKSATELTSENLVNCRHHFLRTKQICEAENDQESKLKKLVALIQKTDDVLTVTYHLKERLNTIQLKDSVVRNQQEFWSQCHTYAKVSRILILYRTQCGLQCHICSKITLASHWSKCFMMQSSSRAGCTGMVHISRKHDLHMGVDTLRILYTHFCTPGLGRFGLACSRCPPHRRCIRRGA
jgi:hypothetical protein